MEEGHDGRNQKPSKDQHFLPQKTRMRGCDWHIMVTSMATEVSGLDGEVTVGMRPSAGGEKCQTKLSGPTENMEKARWLTQAVKSQKVIVLTLKSGSFEGDWNRTVMPTKSGQGSKQSAIMLALNSKVRHC